MIRSFLLSILAIALCFIASSPLSRAEPVTLQRINELPSSVQPAWKHYLEQSAANADADASALQAELAALGMTQALRAPDGGDFKLRFRPGDPWYTSDEAQKLTDIVLSYQSPTGGWSKHTRYSAGPRKPGMQFSSQYEPGRRPHYLATFDNLSTTEQLHFLANVWLATGRDDCQAAFSKGLQFILAAQYPNGGWPQVYPLEGGYHDNITFNDDAMTHVLELLHAIAQGEPRFDFLEDAQRRQVIAALEKGIACVIKTQVVIKGKKTVWCAQHDALTLRPTQARSFEPPSLSGLEGARVLKFLMGLRDPSPELIESIESGLAWLKSAKITGLRRGRRNGRTAYLADPSSTEVYWARFYDLATGKPVFPGRDGTLHDSFDELGPSELDYAFYTTLPDSIVGHGQKKWRNKW